MALITNQAVKRFSNEKCRVLANQLMKVYRTAKQFQLDIVPIESLIAGNDNADVIHDGAEEAGRNVVTKLHTAQLKFVIEQFVGAMETDDRRDLTNNWVHDSTPLF